MRVNIYSQELITGDNSSVFDFSSAIELVSQKSNTGVVYSAVRLFLHSSDKLHHPPMDDDRSAITIWLPKSFDRRAVLSETLHAMGDLVLAAPSETGLD